MKTKPQSHQGTKPRDPRTKAEWQEAVDAAEAALLLDSASKYGLVTGGPTIDVDRAVDLITRGRRRGIVPAKDIAERLCDELMGVRRCRICGCTDAHGCPEGCEWVEWDLCSSCQGKG